jgi:NAD(P)-dependent dehydrogenase (short-subunit alcohol dehydrogenase family)
MDLDLTDRVYLVTGGSRGIGRAVAEALAAEGARVAICGRGEEACRATAGELGAGVTGYGADVAGEGEAERLVERVVDEHGRLDGLVNNAGRFGGGPLETLQSAPVHEGVATKVTGALGLVQAALPALRAGDRPAVVNVSGISAQRITPGAAVTALANAGVVALTSYLAHELLTDGIRVNCVIPGYTLTGVWEERAAALGAAEGLTDQAAQAAILERQGMGHARWGTPAEVAANVVWLLSAPAGFVNGISIRVDGGQLPVVDY